MVVNTGNHNHHERSYIMQLTTTGKQITRNRCHTKPTSITTYSYIQHHTNRHHIRTTDPLQEILDNINKNPELFSNKHVQSTLLTDKNYTWADNVGNQTSNLNKIGVNRGTNMDHNSKQQDNSVQRTRSGHVSKKPDHLMYY